MLQTGLGGRLTRARAIAHWGSELEQFPSKADRIFRDPRKCIKIGKWPVPAQDRARFRLTLGMISYSGTGKYSERTRLHRWTSVPAGEPGTVVPPEPTLPLPVATGPPPEADPFVLPPGLEGWWPVAILEARTDAENAFSAWSAVGWHAGTDTVAVICVYQWGWPEPTAWLTTIDRC